MDRRVSQSLSSGRRVSNISSGEPEADDGASVSLAGIIAAKKITKNFMNRFGRKNTTVSKKEKDVVLENTYQLEPTANYDCSRAESLVKNVISSRLENMTYTAARAAILTKTLSGEVKDHLKSMQEFSRYRLVVYVIVGENKNQDLQVGSRCIWDEKFDTCATVTVQKEEFYCCATVFAIYTD